MPSMQTTVTGNGSSRKAPLMSKFFQTPQRKPSVISDVGSEDSNDSAAPPPIVINPNSARRPSGPPSSRFHKKESRTGTGKLKTMMAFASTSPTSEITPTGVADEDPQTRLESFIPAAPQSYRKSPNSASEQLVREAGGSLDSTGSGTGWEEEYPNGGTKDEVHDSMRNQREAQKATQSQNLVAKGPGIVHRPSVVRKPVKGRRSQEEESKPTTPTTPRASEPTVPTRQPSGYKLQPVAYSPKPSNDEENPAQQAWDSQSEASWTPGDDDPSRVKPQMKPPKLETNVEEEEEEEEEAGEGERVEDAPPQIPPISQMPFTPPRLPLLYFEQDQQVDQMDFAYQKPRHTPTQSGTTSQTDLPASRDAGATSIPGGAQERKPGTKPSPPTIDTAIPRKPVVAGKNLGEPKTPPKEQARGGDADESNNSFYWHSPQSSTDGSTKSPKPLEESKAPEDRKSSGAASKPDKSSTASPDPETALTSATALGFGGPSDWEHFAEYDAEEVDDIDLYTSHKEKEKEKEREEAETAKKLEVSSLNEQVLGGMSPATSIQLRGLISGEREMLPTIQERASEALEEDPLIDRKIMSQGRNDFSVAAVVDAHPPPEPPKRGSQEDISSEGDNRHSTAADATGPTASRGSREEALITSHPSDTQQPIKDSHGLSGEQHLEQRNSGTSSGTDDRESVTPQNPTMPVVAGRTDAESPSRVGESALLANQVSKSTPTKSDDIVEQIIEPRQSVNNRAKSSTRTPDTMSQLTSPASDDGKEDIIISLQVPETPPAGTIPDPLNTEDARTRALPSTQQREQEARSPDVLRSGRRSIYPGSVELENPYSGLEEWAKASLNRYVKMLREEAQAGSDEEKYATFVNFMKREMRVRVVFYDRDDDLVPFDQPAKSAASKNKDKGNVAALNSIKSKALPALPPNPGTPPVPRIEEAASHTADAERQVRQDRNSANSTENTETGLTIEQLAAGVAGASVLAAPALDESFVMVDTPKEDKSKSEKPGEGKEKSSVALKGAPSLNALRKALDIVATRKSSLGKTGPVADTAVPVNQDMTITEEGRASSLVEGNLPPMGLQRDGNMEPGESSPSSDRPSYKSFGYEGKPYEGDKAANRQSIYRPFSTMLRTTSIRSGPSEADVDREKSPGPSINEPPLFGSDGSGRIRERSPKPETPRPVNYRYTVLEPLLAVVPQESILHQEPEQLVRLRQGMDAIPDDFSFIHKTVLAWDAEAKKARERCERERHARQGQNEQRIDELFNGNEIGYSDISRLEADFKRSEAAKKAEEDREEVQTFVASVFDVVWARINYEMDQLSPLYDECTKLVSEASAGRGMFEDTSARVPIAPAMEVLLILYQKLMIRHQKAFEAVLERDRRLKKTEVGPWYAIGSIDKVKRIEKRFEDAEKKAILEFCRQRDERANLLMDVLDQNTLRGVGANQDYMESVMQAVRRIAQDVAMGKGFGPHGAASADNADDVISSEEVLKAKTITTALARSSEQIVQTFHVADMLLNAADYEVSVANAKLSGADAAAFRKLRDAKAKEDAKLALDLEHRMSLIRGDTARTQDEIAKLLMLIERRPGNFGGGANGGPGNALMRAQALQIVQQGQGQHGDSQKVHASATPTPKASKANLNDLSGGGGKSSSQVVEPDGGLGTDEEVFGGALEETKRGDGGPFGGVGASGGEGVVGVVGA